MADDNSPNPLSNYRSFQPSGDNQPQPKMPGQKPAGRIHMPAFWRNWSRRTRIIVSFFVLLVIVAGAAVLLSGNHKSPAASSVVSPKAKKSATVASPLTGMQVAPDLAKRPVTAVMIENSLDARPQSGLYEAGVVYEAVAEGGVTRFMALFQEARPPYVGPVRSLRPYYIHFAAPFQAGIVHVGGSPDALGEVSSGNYRNLDEFANPSYFRRISSRAAPHNVYTDFDQLDKLNQSKNYTTSNFTAWPRKADAKLATPTAKSIDMNPSGPAYAVHYDYDPVSNLYLRHEGGESHNSTSSEADSVGLELRPKVVIALVMSASQGALDASGAYYTNYQDSGSGSVYIFQDGGLTQGTWAKSGPSDQFSFKDGSGNPIKLDAGQTWITIVQAGQMSYAP